MFTESVSPVSESFAASLVLSASANGCGYPLDVEEVCDCCCARADM